MILSFLLSNSIGYEIPSHYEIAVGLVLVLVGWFWHTNGAKRPASVKQLPSPRGLPIVGNLPQVMKSGQLCQWTKEYGDMYLLNIGPLRYIIVSNPGLCKDIFSSDLALIGRPTIAPDFCMYPEQPEAGFTTAEGTWNDIHQRALRRRQGRDLGFGKQSMETLITNEMNEVLSVYKTQCGKPVAKIREQVMLAVVNSIWMLVTSQRYDHTDPELLHLANNISKVKEANDVTPYGGLLAFPGLKYVVPGFSGYNQIRTAVQENRRKIEEAIRQHTETFDKHVLRDLIDVYLWEMSKEGLDSDSFFDRQTAERYLAVTIFHLFFAGSDTTAAIIAWGIFYLTKFPNIQGKLQKEIDDVVGVRNVSLKDRPKMPYMQATVDEILRCSSIACEGSQRRALGNAKYEGYFFPKDAFIQPNLKYIHYNTKWFEDPQQFKPERFLRSDGKKYIRSQYLMQFQIEGRQVAESLANDTIFLYLSNIFHAFEVTLDPSLPEPEWDSEDGFLRKALQFSVLMKERN